MMRRHLGRCSKPLLLLGLLSIAVIACGGRTQLEETTDAADAGQAGNTAGIGGSGRRVTGTGGSSTAGQAGSGPTLCDNVACPAIGCGPGSVGVTPQGACCPLCQPIVCNGACAGIACGTGSHLETPPGQCCPTCVRDASDVCQAGQKAYTAYAAQAIEKYRSSFLCMTAMECVVVPESNRCGSGCGFPLSSGNAKDAQRDLESFANASCGSCPPQPSMPCAASPLFCINNKCSFGR